MKTKILLIILAFFVTIIAIKYNHADATKSFKNFINTKNYQIITVNRHKYPYLVHVPPQYDFNKPMPLVMVFHGAGGNPKSVEEMTEMSLKADKEGFIVAYPGGTGYLPNNKTFLSWHVSNDYKNEKDKNILYINTLINTLQAGLNIDSKRIYATGFSNGGAMAYKTGYMLSDKIAAIGVVSGFFDPKQISYITPMPIMIFHGTKDKNICYNGGVPRKLLDKLQRKFLWYGGSSVKKKYALVSWTVVCRSKEQGGLGVLDLNLINKALLTKWWIRFLDTTVQVKWK